MHQVYLSLGTNVGIRADNLKSVQYYLKRLVGTIEAQSSIYETQPWGVSQQANFLNMVVVMNTSLSPSNTLLTVLAIEKIMGRVRKEKWNSRLIDIDLLFYDDLILQEPFLEIPHPFIQERNFVLVPLNEIAATKVHPVFNKSIRTLLNSCKDSLNCQIVM